MSVTLPFEVGRTYRRKDLHDSFGGQRQGGISTPQKSNLILLFTGGVGTQHGYADGWEPDGTFRYFGKGQRGDMRMDGGNKILLNHAHDGREVHLFEILKGGLVRYVAHMAVDSVQEHHNVPDTNKVPRNAFAFRLVPLSDLIAPTHQGKSSGDGVAPQFDDDASLWGMSIDELRRLADETPPSGSDQRTGQRNIYRRSGAVRVYVLRRANGYCESCGEPAPFKTPRGTPYLEPHHTRLLSDGGPDHRAWVIATCPTCHRRAHYAENAREFNETLKTKASSLEGQTR